MSKVLFLPNEDGGQQLRHQQQLPKMDRKKKQTFYALFQQPSVVSLIKAGGSKFEILILIVMNV